MSLVWCKLGVWREVEAAASSCYRMVFQTGGDLIMLLWVFPPYFLSPRGLLLWWIRCSMWFLTNRSSYFLFSNKYFNVCTKNTVSMQCRSLFLRSKRPFVTEHERTSHATVEGCAASTTCELMEWYTQGTYLALSTITEYTHALHKQVAYSIITPTRKHTSTSCMWQTRTRW